MQAEVERRIGRASALNHDLTGPHRVLALQPAGGRWPEGEAVGDLVEQAARTLDMPFLGTLRGQTAILVCGTPGTWVDGDGSATAPWSDRAGRRRAGRASARRRRSGRGRPSTTLSPTCCTTPPSSGSAATSNDPSTSPAPTARPCRRSPSGCARPSPRGLIAFEDLGLYRLLATPEGRREASAFVKDWLGSLLAYDTERQAGLVHTLGVYLDHGGNYDDTAAALHIHRSTLRYRLQRIRELSGHDLTHPDTRLNLHVAVRAAVVAEPPVLRPPTTPPPPEDRRPQRHPDPSRSEDRGLSDQRCNR